MAFEMICGQCRGNLLVEQFGVVVACPHCGAHLSIPAPTPPATASVPVPDPVPVPQPVPVPPPLVVPVPIPIPVTQTESMPAAPPPQVADEMPPSVDVEAAPSEEPVPATAIEPIGEVTNDSPVIEPFTTDSESPLELEQTTADPIASEGFSLESLMSASDAPSEVVVAPKEETPAIEVQSASESTPIEQAASISEPTAESMTISSESHVTEEAHADDSQFASSSAIVPAKSDGPKADNEHVLVSRVFLMFLMSYASALTLGFCWLLYNQRPTPSNYGIESLPDVEPPKAKNGKKVSFLPIPENAEMPPLHDLAIGDSQRYGNIKVTVLKVTRGPLQFTHFKTHEPRAIPTSPVLKLWLKFENISADQDIEPLDGRLLFTRKGDILTGWKANQFVCRQQHKGKPDTLKVLTYDHQYQGDWDLAGMTLGKPLAPGESREYYIPTGENDIEKLEGDLLWRVHCRKGFGPKGNGVTTVFEVLFHSKDIQPENA